MKIYIALYFILLSLFSSFLFANNQVIANKWIYDNAFTGDTLFNDVLDSNIALKGDQFYFGGQKFPVKTKEAEINQFLAQNNIKQLNSSPLEKVKHRLNIFYDIKLKDTLTYIQFDESIDNTALRPYLTLHRQAILLDNKLFLLNNGYLYPYIKPYFEDEFKQEIPKLKYIQLPINSNSDFDSQFIKIPTNYKTFLALPDYGFEIEIAELSPSLSNIHLILTKNYLETGDIELYLHLFSKDYKLLDKLLISNYETSTRGGLGCKGYDTGRMFKLDKDHHMVVNHLFDDETLEISQYQVTSNGKIEEKTVTTSCAMDIQPKDNNIHSSKSLLLTSRQFNNYLRSANRFYFEGIGNLTLTLNPEQKQLCIDYLQAYPVTFGTANSRQFFGHDELFKQQVENFKKYGIDISEKLQYVKFNNIENLPLAKLLLNGNQAIYMNNTLFFVGQKHFAVYRQPTQRQLTYTEDDCDIDD